ncbi:SDR family NAD(P)-dependent oxidoreductase [Caballeronia calidae]|uniref:SDR family NAD(P)-dependent oxidoreductase n=1 Tax=Caballeronia calidae TaxID=1777139 RepID=UPI0018DFF884|nr:SDR family NAD(P)-dependent oxidoreductase [Caballeronia calidae]
MIPCRVYRNKPAISELVLVAAPLAQGGHAVVRSANAEEAQKSGHIVTTASVAAHKVFPSSAVYSATQYAVRALSRDLLKKLTLQHPNHAHLAGSSYEGASSPHQRRGRSNSQSRIRQSRGHSPKQLRPNVRIRGEPAGRRGPDEVIFCRRKNYKGHSFANFGAANTSLRVGAHLFFRTAHTRAIPHSSIC